MYVWPPRFRRFPGRRLRPGQGRQRPRPDDPGSDGLRRLGGLPGDREARGARAATVASRCRPRGRHRRRRRHRRSHRAREELRRPGVHAAEGPRRHAHPRRLLAVDGSPGGQPDQVGSGDPRPEHLHRRSEVSRPGRGTDLLPQPDPHQRQHLPPRLLHDPGGDHRAPAHERRGSHGRHQRPGALLRHRHPSGHGGRVHVSARPRRDEPRSSGRLPADHRRAAERLRRRQHRGRHRPVPDGRAHRRPLDHHLRHRRVRRHGSGRGRGGLEQLGHGRGQRAALRPLRHRRSRPEAGRRPERGARHGPRLSVRRPEHARHRLHEGQRPGPEQRRHG